MCFCNEGVTHIIDKKKIIDDWMHDTCWGRYYYVIDAWKNIHLSNQIYSFALHTFWLSHNRRFELNLRQIGFFWYLYSRFKKSVNSIILITVLHFIYSPSATFLSLYKQLNTHNICLKSHPSNKLRLQNLFDN